MQCVSLHTSLFVLSPFVSIVGVAVSLSEWPRLTPPLCSFVWSTPVLYYYYTRTYLLHNYYKQYSDYFHVCVSGILLSICSCQYQVLSVHYEKLMLGLCDIIYCIIMPHLASQLVVHSHMQLYPGLLPFMPVRAFCDETAVLVDLIDKSDNASLSLSLSGDAQLGELFVSECQHVLICCPDSQHCLCHVAQTQPLAYIIIVCAILGSSSVWSLHSQGYLCESFIFYYGTADLLLSVHYRLVGAQFECVILIKIISLCFYGACVCAIVLRSLFSQSLPCQLPACLPACVWVFLLQHILVLACSGQAEY